MTKLAIVLHAFEQAIIDFSPKISARTDFSPPSVQITLLAEQIGLGRTFPPHFDASQPHIFFHACLHRPLIVAAHIIVIPASLYATLYMTELASQKIPPEALVLILWSQGM